MINVMDLETFVYNGKLRAYCLCAWVYGKKYVLYGDDVVSRFLSEMTRLEFEVCVIYCHNLTFDGSWILQCGMGAWRVKSSLLERGAIFMLGLQCDNKRLEFRCSYKLMPFSLLYLSKSFKLEISKGFFKHDDVTVDNVCDEWLKEKAIEYCYNDVMVTVRVLESIFKIIDSVDLRALMNIFSVSGLSFWLFKTIFNNKKIEFNMDDSVEKALRESYMGGRCEVFGNAKDFENVYHFDFNGMYGMVMMEKYGIGKLKLETDVSEVKRVGFYRVIVESVGLNIPILGHRSLKNKKLMFTNGIFEGVYWWEEIDLFLKNGGKILKIIECWTYSNDGFVFKNFIKKFMEIRKRSDVGNVVGKMIINSLFGRLGIRDRNSETKAHSLKDYVKKYDKNIIKEIEINEIIIVVKMTKYTQRAIKSNVGLASAITSKARIKLWKAFKDVESESRRVLYTDTDSLFVASFENLIDKKFGEVEFSSKRRDCVVESSVFVKPKCYGVIINGEEIVKIKGIRRGSVSIVNLRKARDSREEIIMESVRLMKSSYTMREENYVKIIDLNGSKKRIFDERNEVSWPYYVIDGNYSGDPM